MRESEINLNEHFRLIYRHRQLIIIAFVCVMLPLLYMIRQEKAVYKSSVTFAIRNESIAEEVVESLDIGIDLTIANQLDLLQSITFLGRVYDALPDSVRRMTDPNEPSLMGQGVHLVKKILGMPIITLSNRAEGIMDIERRTSVDHRGGDVIQVTVSSSDPKKAKVIAETYAEQFALANLEAMRQKITALDEYFTNQIESSYTKLKAAEDKLEKFKRTRGIVAEHNQASALWGRLNSIETQYIELKTQRELAEQRQALLEKKLKDLEGNYPSVADLEGSLPKIKTLKQHLSDLEQEKMAASAIYTEKHPKLVGIEKDIEETVKQLRDITKGQVGDEVRVVDWQNLFVEKLLSEVEIANLKSKEYSYKALLEDYKKRLLYDLPEKEKGMFQLLKEVELSQQMYQSLLNNHERLQMVAAEKAGNVTILEPALEPVAPVPSKRMLKLAFGLVLGVVVGIGLAYLAELLNLTIRTIEEVETKIQLPVLGTIMDIKPFISKSPNWRGREQFKRSLYGLICLRSPDSVVAENFKTLSTNMLFKFNGNGNGKGHALLVTSPGPGEGKSTVASNLALALAQSGRKTILIDADMRRPVQHKIFGLDVEAGLSDILVDSKLSTEIKRPETQVPVLDLMTCGKRTNQPAELLASKNMQKLIETLSSQYSYVIIDAPPVLTVADSMNISKRVDGVVLVFQSGKTQREAAKRAKEVLKNLKVNIFGVVLNKLNVRNEYGPYSYYNQYYYSYADSKSRRDNNSAKKLV